MFCSKCGKNLDTESKFCNDCGSATSNKATAESCDEEIRSELGKYNKITKETILCLECGYNGFMGISNQKVDPQGLQKSVIYSFIFLFCVFFFLAPMSSGIIGSLIYVIAGLIVAMASGYFTRKYWICPACKQPLLPKKQS